jgi:hypothetical protein
LASKQFHHCLTEYLTDTVVVYIIEAKDLPPMDANGLSDPYCFMYAVGPGIKRSAEKRKTATFSKTLNPVFNERHVFGTETDLQDIQHIVIDVYDADNVSAHDLLGRVVLELSEIDRSPTKAVHGWCPLRSPKTGEAGLGALLIHAEFEGAGQSSMGVPSNIEKAAGCQLLGPHDGVESVTQQERDAMSIPVGFDRLDAGHQEDVDVLSTVCLCLSVALSLSSSHCRFSCMHA